MKRTFKAGRQTLKLTDDQWKSDQLHKVHDTLFRGLIQSEQTVDDD